MGYGIRDGDIISLKNTKAGALTLSTSLYDYRASLTFDPVFLWGSQPAVRAVVDLFTHSISTVDFNLYNRRSDGGRVRNYTHEVAQALETPGYKLPGERFIQQLMLDKMLYDRWAFMVNPLDDGTGRLEYLRMPAERITIVTDEFGRYVALGIVTDEGLKFRSLDQFVFDVGPGPTAKNRKPGHPALATLADLAAELNGMSDYRANLFRNSAMVPAVIERPTDAPKWTDEAFNRFKNEFSTYKAGGGNAGGMPLLEDGMKLSPVDVFNPKDSQYIEVRQLALVEAAQALRIPPELLGAREGTHSNIVALREQLYVDVLGADIRFLKGALNVGLKKWMQRNQYIDVDMEHRVRGSMLDRAKIYQALVGAPIWTPNEARAKENMSAIDGGDELVKPLNVTNADQANPQDSAPDDNGQDEKDGKLARNPKARPASAGGSNSKADNPWQDIDDATDRLEKTVLKWWHGWANRLADQLGVDLEADYSKEKGRKALATLPDRAEIVEEATVLSQILFAQTQQIAELGAEKVFVEWNPDREGFDVGAQRAWLAKAAENNALRFADQYVYKMLAEAMADPLTWQEGIQRTLATDKDALVWVNGLATEAASFGGYDAARASGLTQKQWHVTSAHPRESHSRQNGQTVELDGFFMNGQRWPGDWYGGFSEVANCRCRMDFRK